MRTSTVVISLITMFFLACGSSSTQTAPVQGVMLYSDESDPAGYQSMYDDPWMQTEYDRVFSETPGAWQDGYPIYTVVDALPGQEDWRRCDAFSCVDLGEDVIYFIAGYEYDPAVFDHAAAVFALQDLTVF